LHRALLRGGKAPATDRLTASNGFGDLGQAAAAAGLAAMMGEHFLGGLRPGRDGFINLGPSHAVTIADVHPALL